VVIVIAKLRLVPEMATSMLHEVERLAQHSRGEAGCLEFSILRSVGDEYLLVLLERWLDHSALSGHRESAFISTYRERTRHFVVGREIVVFGATPA
jgi:quinol monooxygenase YgiN